MTPQEDFRRLYEEHWTAVLRYCRRRASAEIADEALNETFLIAWRRLDDVPRDARTWLIGVARKVLANYWRRERRRQALQDRLAATEWRPVAPPEDPADAEALRRALSELSELDREALMLVYWDGLSPTQAAAVLEASPVAVRVRLHRARRRLADRMSNCAERRTALAIEEAAS
jgi:RNA polymerase sigma factor (sigma-70 family)